MTAGRVLAFDLFAGARGWDVHAEEEGLDVIGFEWDEDACATARAAGMFTVQDDVARLVPETIAAVYGQPEGVIASAPCQLFSTAGKGAGRGGAIMEVLRRGVDAAAAGATDIELARFRVEIRRLLRLHLRETMGSKRGRRARHGGRVKTGHVESSPVTRAQINAEAERMSRNVCLVWQPARWAERLRPRWLAFEQVPPVLPLWQVMGRALEVHGYKCWTGILSSERYGVPQTRKRAFLVASLDGQPHPPEPTHQKYVPGEPARDPEPDLFGPGLLPWRSMAQALGWGNGRMGFARLDDTGTSADGYRERDWRDVTAPSSAVTEKLRSATREVDPDKIEVELRRSDGSGPRRPRKGSEPSPTIRAGEGGGCGPNLVVRHTGSTKGGTRPEGLERSADAPARTVDSRADQWEVEAGDVELVANEQPKAAVRRADEPAPTIKGGHDTADRKWRLRNGTHEHRAERLEDEPAPTLHFGERLNTVTWAPEDGMPPRDPEHTVLDRRQTGGDGIPVGPRPATAPAPTMTAEGLRGGRDVWRDDDPDASWTTERPAPTITGTRRSKDGGLVGRQMAQGEGENVGGHGSADDRPATTVAGDPRVFPPGHKLNDDDVRAGRDGQLRSGAGRSDGDDRTAAVRVSVHEAAVLQSFPPDWPFQGNRTSQFQQIGNAVPPDLARPVLTAAMAPTRARTLTPLDDLRDAVLGPLRDRRPDPFLEGRGPLVAECDVELVAAALRLASRKTRAPRNVRAASDQFERSPGSATEGVLVEVAWWYADQPRAPQYVTDAVFYGWHSPILVEELRRA